MEPLENHLRGRRIVPIHSIFYSVAQPLERGSNNYYSIIQGDYMGYKQDFIKFMVRSGVLTFGDFITKSGRPTPYFVNTGNYRTASQI